jgi:hypothetical protein
VCVDICCQAISDRPSTFSPAIFSAGLSSSARACFLSRFRGKRTIAKWMSYFLVFSTFPHYRLLCLIWETVELPGWNVCIVAPTAADHFNGFYLFNRQVLDSGVVRQKIHIHVFERGKSFSPASKLFVCLFGFFFYYVGFFFRFLFYFPFDYCAEFNRPFPAKKNECVFHPF